MKHRAPQNVYAGRAAYDEIPQGVPAKAAAHIASDVTLPPMAVHMAGQYKASCLECEYLLLFLERRITIIMTMITTIITTITASQVKHGAPALRILTSPVAPAVCRPGSLMHLA